MSADRMYVVLVTAEELAAGRVVLPPKVVREALGIEDGWFACDDDVWNASTPLERRERTVSQTLPESQCPECGGSGEGYRYTQLCAACEGRGSLVVIHLATEHCGHDTDRHNRAICEWERRQAIVGYVTPTVLPVVEQDTLSVCAVGEHLVLFADGQVYRCSGSGQPHTSLVRVDEPWVQGLVPGALVVEWDTVTPIDPPIVEMVCQGCDEAPGRIALIDGQPEHIVSLSLEQGQLTEVEW